MKTTLENTKNTKTEKTVIKEGKIDYIGDSFKLIYLLLLLLPTLLYDLLFGKFETAKGYFFGSLFRCVPGIWVALKTEALIAYFDSPAAKDLFPSWMLEYGNFFWLFVAGYTIWNLVVVSLLSSGTTIITSGSGYSGVDSTTEMLDRKLSTMSWYEKNNMLDKLMKK